MSCTYTVTKHINSIGSIERTLCLMSSTTSSSACLSIEQIDISQTQIRQIGLKCTTPVVHTIVLVTLVRNKFLTEITGTATISLTLRVTCWNHVTTCEQLKILEWLVNLIWISIQELEAVEHDIVIETWVTILERMSWIKTRLCIERTVCIQNRLTISHTVCIVHIVGRWHVDQSVVFNQVVNLWPPQLSKVPVRTVDIRLRTTHNSLNTTRHLPTLTGCTEDIRVIAL